MNGFIAIASALTLAALVAVLFPLLRRQEGSPEAWRSGGILAVLVAVGAAALYPLWSNFQWDAPAPAADSPEAMVGRLARRLEKEPDDLQGWLLLGKSYSVLAQGLDEAGAAGDARGQWSLAARAYERANTLAEGGNAEAAMGLAEALVSNGSSDLGGRAGRLFEQALDADPNSARALYFSALAAVERNEIPLARQRFQRILDANPPENVRGLFEDYLAELDAIEKMAASTAEAVTVPLRVSLGGALAGRAFPAPARLFVSARVPGQPVPPIAALRLEPTFPQEVDLRSTDAAMGGTGFKAGQQIEIKAHVSLDGGATSHSGDPFGTVVVEAGGAQRIRLEINQLTP